MPYQIAVLGFVQASQLAAHRSLCAIDGAPGLRILLSPAPAESAQRHGCDVRIDWVEVPLRLGQVSVVVEDDLHVVGLELFDVFRASMLLRIYPVEFFTHPASNSRVGGADFVANLENQPSRYAAAFP